MYGRGRRGCLSGLRPCVSAVCRAGVPCLADGVDVRSSIQGSLGIKQVSMPSASETTQQPTRPRASEGNQASPLASPSSPPVQCTIPNPLAFFLILVFFTGRKGGDLYRHAHRVLEGRPGLQQDAENNLSRRSRFANILNVPQRVLLRC